MSKKAPLLIILMFPVAVCFLAWYFWYSPVATVILVRHAERLNNTDTTSISEIGIRRARTLAHVLSSAGLKRIYVSEKQRTGQTASPSAEAFNLSPIAIPGSEVRRYVDSVKSHRGDTILIVGHSDTVPQLIGKLGIASPPAIGKMVFDDLFVVTVFRFRSSLVHLKFGDRSATE